MLQSKPYLSQTEKDSIRQSVDNFIVNPCDTTLLEFKNLFDLKEIVYDAYSLPASLMDASSKEKMKFRMNVYCEQTPYAKFLIEVLSEPAIALGAVEPEEDYKNIHAHTKLSQLITQPHIFKHILKIENLIENGKEQTNAVLSAVFFHEVMASSDIEPHVKLRNHINYKYNLFDYNAKQSIFLLTYAPYEELKEALEYLNTNKVAMYATFLKDKILHKSDNKLKSKEEIEKVADFLKKFALEKTKIYDENLSEENEIKKIVNYLVDMKSQLDLLRPDTEAELQIYFCLWAFAFTNTSGEYRHEVLKQYINNSVDFFVEKKKT